MSAAKPSRISCLVLAAGSGTRFRAAGGGGSKLLARYGSRAVIAAVLHPIHDAISEGLLRGGVLVHAESQAEIGVHGASIGLGTVAVPDGGTVGASLNAGLSAIGREDNLAALIFLGDQPGVQLSVIRQLCHLGLETPARPRYRGDPETPGHPVLIPRRLWPRIRVEDEGFRVVFARCGIAPIIIEADGALRDIDTPNDLSPG